MADQPDDVMRVDPAKLRSLVTIYENAAFRVHRILDDLARRGRVEVPWTADEVSVEMAAHYNAQIFDGEYSTYAAIAKYESELWAVARTLRRMHDDYERTDAEAAATIQAAGSTGGW
jgi:hypothetical protein